METQLTQDKNPVAKPEDQAAISPPVEQPANGPATTPLAPKNAGEAKSETFTLTPRPIPFTNGNKAQLVYPPPDTPAEAIVAALGLEKPESLLLIAEGSATLNDEIKSHLVQLFSRSLARTAAETKTVIIDEGRLTDLTGITGRGIADRFYKSILLGITKAAKITHPDLAEGAGAPGRVALEPHHSHFVLLAEAEKRSEAEIMAQVAALLGGGKPVVTVLAGGGELAKDQVVQSVRQDWPILIIKGTGGLADEITNTWQQRPRPFIADPELAEIISEGKLYFFELKDSIEGFGHLLKWLAKPHQASDYDTLELVWNRFGMYDDAAKRQQRYFRVIQNWVLILGVLGTLLALVHYVYQANFVPQAGTLLYISWVLYGVLLIIPITVSLLIAAANRFNAGSKWIALRATAESIKKEIYLYRAHADAYSAAETTTTSREVKLVRKLDTLSSKLMQSEVNVSASKPYSGAIPPQYAVAGGDDGFSFLTPDRYLTYRLQDQLDWYRNKTVRLERQLLRFQWLVLGFGALGTLLVAVGLELWIALTTSLVAAFTTYLEYQKVEETLIRYNQTANDLANIQSWWTALSPAEKADPKNINKLVGQTETVIHSEHGAWVKEQQEAMAELRAAQAEQEGSQNLQRFTNLAAGQAQQVKESLANLSNFLEDAPATSPQAQQVKEGVQSLATMVKNESLSPEQAVQVLDQVTTRDELVETAAAKPVEDEQTQDSLSILASLLDNTRLDMPQVQQTLSSLSGLAQLIQTGALSGEQVEKALGGFSRLSHLFASGEISPGQIKKALASLPNLNYLIQPGVLTGAQLEKALNSLPSLVGLWESGRLSTEPVERILAALPNLAQLVQQGNLSAPQFERVLVSLPNLAQLAQPNPVSSERVNQLLAAAERLKTLAADQIHQVLARLPDLIRLLAQEEPSPEQIALLIDSLVTLSILLEDKELTEEEFERVLQSLALLIVLLDEQNARFRPQKG